jgi:hypothetical protein
VPANEIVRADQNTANALFFRSLTSNLRNGAVFRASHDKDSLRNNPSMNK